MHSSPHLTVGHYLRPTSHYTATGCLSLCVSPTSVLHGLKKHRTRPNNKKLATGHVVVGVAAGTLLRLSCMHLSWWWFCEFWMSTHAKMRCYSTVTAPLSTLDELGVVCVAAGPAKGRSEKPGWVCAHLLVRTRSLLFQCCSPQGRRAARRRPRRPARPNVCLRCAAREGLQGRKAAIAARTT